MNMNEGEIELVEPETAVLHVVEVPLGEGRIRIECEATHLFDTKKCLDSWMTRYSGPAGSVFQPQEFLDHISRGGKARVAVSKV